MGNLRKRAGLLVVPLAMLCVAFVFSFIPVNVNAETQEAVADDVATFYLSDPNDTGNSGITPFWYGPALLTGDMFYNNLTNEGPMECKYDPNSAFVNTEKYRLYASDSTGEEKKLNPETSLSTPVSFSIYAEGYTTVYFRYEEALPTDSLFGNDILAIGNINPYLKPAVSSGAIGTGKIFYRSKTYASGQTSVTFTPSDWKYINLSPTYLSFPASSAVQICLVYSIEETGKWWQPNVWYHIVGNYLLQTV